MNIKIQNSFLFIILIILIGQTHSQQIQYSRPMIAVKKHQPAYEILINDKKLNPSVFKDIIRIDIQQRIYNPGSFKIKLSIVRVLTSLSMPQTSDIKSIRSMVSLLWLYK